MQIKIVFLMSIIAFLISGCTPKYSPKLSEKYISDNINSFSRSDQIQAIQKYPYNIKDIKNPDIELQKIAISKVPWLIKYINNPSKELQLLAVGKDGSAIEYLSNPDKELETLAISQNIENFKFLKKSCTRNRSSSYQKKW
jgi:hypothetical protein